MPDRRRFLGFLTSGAVLAAMPMPGWPAVAGYQRLLVLVELKGGNDGLNTIVPFADPAYAALRPRLALERHSLLQLDERTGAHPQLSPLQAIWQQRELAIVQSVGYPDANLSHFRSIEIWDTASRSNQYLEEGWLGRTFAGKAPPASYAADGVAVGSAELGPLAGGHARTVAIANARQFQQLARTAQPRDRQGGGALQHLLKVEEDIAVAAQRLSSSYQFKTQFPDGAFGESVKAACQIVAGGTGVAAIRLSLNGFDTHQNQPAKHADLLRQLAEGLLALRSAMQELGRWNETLVMTYGEFGRRAKENQSNGTDHGTAAPQLVLGGRVAGGLFGEAPRLNQLDGNGNLPFAVDFRSLYATVLEDWWGMPSNTVLGGRFERLPLLRG